MLLSTTPPDNHLSGQISLGFVSPPASVLASSMLPALDSWPASPRNDRPEGAMPSDGGRCGGRNSAVDELRIVELPLAADERGLSVSVLAVHLKWVGPVQDLHFASIRPGTVRGNHFHTSKREAVAVAATSGWSLHWDAGVDTEATHRVFTGEGAVLVEVPPLWAHAIRNEGDADLWIVAISDRPYEAGETVARRLVDSF
jgi:dTDP-4-dehydrorhamnose 3,5-epimerase-like enzyme